MPPPTTPRPLMSERKDSSAILCANRTHGCSGHGDCIDQHTCVCDEQYEGRRCDVWRSATKPDMRQLSMGLQSIQWINCTHARSGDTNSDIRQL
eukprot:SAG31_NODE_18257_length_642_cov_0.839779_2_plen_93_part_01